MLLLAGLVHVPYSPVLLLTLLGEMALAAAALTALGMMLASRMTQIESFQAVMQFVVLPMFFLSGAVFPASGLPAWLAVLTRLDPLSYAVDPMRRAVFAHVRTPVSFQHALNPGIAWGHWRLPVGLELVLIAAAGAVMLALAIAQFNRTE